MDESEISKKLDQIIEIEEDLALVTILQLCKLFEERIEALEAKPKTLAQLQADAYRNPKRSNGNGSAY